MSSLTNRQDIILHALGLPSLSLAQKGLLVTLISFSNRSGECSRSLTALADFLNMTKSHLCKQLKQLENQNVISKRSRGFYIVDFNVIESLKPVVENHNSIVENDNLYRESQVVENDNSIVENNKDDRGREVVENNHSIVENDNSVVEKDNPIVENNNSDKKPSLSFNSINTKNVLIEKEREKEKTPPLSPTLLDASVVDSKPPARPRKKSSARKKTAFPSDFTVTDDMWNWYAKQTGFVLPIEQATETWADAMRAKGLQYVDWKAAWRNGMKNQNKWERKDREQGQQRTHTDIANQAAEEWCDEHGVEFRWK